MLSKLAILQMSLNLGVSITLETDRLAVFRFQKRLSARRGLAYSTRQATQQAGNPDSAPGCETWELVPQCQ
jgi:hypothetical protein